MSGSLGAAIGEVLPPAVGVALSPLPICAIILLLLGGGGRRAAGGLVLGWVLGLAVAAVVVLVLGRASEVDRSSTTDGIGWGKVAVGVLRAVLAVQNRRKRPKSASTRIRHGGWNGLISSVRGRP